MYTYKYVSCLSVTIYIHIYMYMYTYRIHPSFSKCAYVYIYKKHNQYPVSNMEIYPQGIHPASHPHHMLPTWPHLQRPRYGVWCISILVVGYCIRFVSLNYICSHIYIFFPRPPCLAQACLRAVPPPRRTYGVGGLPQGHGSACYLPICSRRLVSTGRWSLPRCSCSSS